MAIGAETGKDVYSRVAEMTRIGWFEFDISTNTIHCSPHLCKLLGLDEAVISGDDYMKLVDPEYYGMLVSTLDAVLKQERFEYTVPMMLAAGRTWMHVWGELKGPSDSSPQPKVLCVLQVIDTPTSNEQAEVLSRMDEVAFRKVFDSIPAGIEIYDVDGCLIDNNQGDVEVFGLKDRRDLYGIKLFDNPNLSEQIKQNIKLRDSYEFYLDYRFDKIRSSYYSSSRQGTCHLYCRVNKIFDSLHNFIGYVFILIDITEQANAAEKVSDFNRLFRLVSDYAHVGFAKLNLLNKEGFGVHQWFDNLGVDESVPLDNLEASYGMLHPADKQRILAFYDGMRNGSVKEFEDVVRVYDSARPGAWKWIRLAIILNRYQPESGIIEAMGVSYDITALKETEANLIEARDKAQAADRLKSSFLANMSHEIRTPLNAIVGFSSLLCEDIELEDKKEYQALIQKNNDCLLKLINDILDLSKIEAGTFVMNFTELDADQVCQDVIRSMEAKCPSGVMLLYEPALSPQMITSDVYRLEQVLSNYIGNAFKFTEKGVICLSYALTADLRHIRFRVRDTGCGIPSDKLDLVFDRFAKLDNFTQGTGLGLSICKNIAERLGGSVGVESKVGQGSCFWIELPVGRD